MPQIQQIVQVTPILRLFGAVVRTILDGHWGPFGNLAGLSEKACCFDYRVDGYADTAIAVFNRLEQYAIELNRDDPNGPRLFISPAASPFSLQFIPKDEIETMPLTYAIPTDFCVAVSEELLSYARDRINGLCRPGQRVRILEDRLEN